MITCSENALFYEPVMWVFELIKKAYKIDLPGDQQINIKIGVDEKDQVQISNSFYQKLILEKKYGFEHHLGSKPIITLEDGRPDFISSIFYLVNGFQEYDLSDERKDKYGRLDFKYSLQSKYDVLQDDLVKKYTQELLLQIDSSLKLPDRKSRIFISHDIDSVYGSLKYDGLWALKSGNLGQMMKVIAQTVMSDPPWFNMDKIARLENEHDIKACYYWIVQNGRDELGIKNGDYKIGNRKIQEQLKVVRGMSNQIGLHKSSMKTSFEEEIKALPEVNSNRYHFLKINNPSSFIEMEKSDIESDSSIGFPYHMGFKNNCGMPYHPFDIERNGKVNVLEIPLHIMDGMFDTAHAKSGQKATSEIIDFIEANNTNAIISILWHNSEMTNFAYKWSFECYKKLLKYFADSNYDTVLPSQLVKEYETA